MRHATEPVGSSLSARPSRLRVVMLWLLAGVAVLAPMVLPDAAAQSERGQGVEFPFRDESGRLMWVATADRVQAEPRARDPFRDDRSLSAFEFDTAADRRPDDDGVARGVQLVMPFDWAGGPRPLTPGRRAAHLSASRATFFPRSELVRLTDVRLRIDLGPGRAAGADETQPARLRTPLLYVAFRPALLRGTPWYVPDDPEQPLGARLFTTAAMSLHVPSRRLHVRQARGLDLRDGDPLGRIRFGSRVRGYIADADWLDLAAAESRTWGTRDGRRGQALDPDTTPGVVQFSSEGPCELELGPRFEMAPQRVRMSRGVLLRQAVEGRELACEHLSLDLTGPADGALRHAEARENVWLHVAHSLRARGGRFEFAVEVDPDGTHRQLGTFDNVEVIRLYTLDRDPLAATGFSQSDERVATRIDAMAEGRVTYRREVRPSAGRDGTRGDEQWTMEQFARLERWATVLGAEAPADGPQVPNFGAPGLRATAPVERVEPSGDARRAQDGYRLVHAINGSGVRKLASPSEAERGRVATVDPARPGQIDVRFRLRDRTAANQPAAGPGRWSREPLREFDGATVRNPGVRPIVEIFEEGAQGMRFFADQLDVVRTIHERSPGVTPTERLSLRFQAARPQVTWITLEDRFGLWESSGGAGTVFRYSFTGEQLLTFEEDRPLGGDVPDTRRVRAPGTIAMRKSPYQRAGEYDDRRLIDWDCRDLELDFQRVPDGKVQLSAVRAKALSDGPMRLRVGRDTLRCMEMSYERRRAHRPAGERSPLVPWTEDILLRGPVTLELRDERSATIFPLRDEDGASVTPAFTTIQAESRVWIRIHTLRSENGETAPQPLARQFEFVGPFSLQAFRKDPDRASADEAPEMLARVSGEYLDARVAVDSPTGPDRLEHALAVGNIKFDYRLQGLYLAGQRVDYQDDPARQAAAGGRLRLLGDPVLRITRTGPGAQLGEFAVAFPPARDPVLQASRRVELLGSPWRVQVRPRARLVWRPGVDGAEALELEADELDAAIRPLGPDGRPVPAGEETDEPLTDLTAGRDVTVARLLGVGDVRLRTGSREARGDTFLWRSYDGQYGYLWGDRALVSDTSAAGLQFELQAQGRSPRDRDLVEAPGPWLPGPGDPAPPASSGTTFRYLERDPDHPHRRDVIHASDPQSRLRLRLRLPDRPEASRDLLPTSAGER